MTGVSLFNAKSAFNYKKKTKNDELIGTSDFNLHSLQASPVPRFNTSEVPVCVMGGGWTWGEVMRV